jgi:hypothetical protein
MSMATTVAFAAKAELRIPVKKENGNNGAQESQNQLNPVLEMNRHEYKTEEIRTPRMSSEK